MKLADLIINLKWMDTTPLEYALKIVGHCYFVANKLKKQLILNIQGENKSITSFLAAQICEQPLQIPLVVI